MSEKILRTVVVMVDGTKLYTAASKHEVDEILNAINKPRTFKTLVKNIEITVVVSKILYCYEGEFTIDELNSSMIVFK